MTKRKRETEKDNEKAIFKEKIKENLKNLQITYNKKQVAYTFLDMDGNRLGIKLKKISSSIQSYTYLRQIDLSFNSFENFESLSKLKFLIKLNLSNNLIHNIKSLSKKNKESENEEEIEIRWKSLKFLNLSNNKIHELTGGFNCPEIIDLDLGSNEIRKIDNFEGIPNLEVLDLSNNQISDIKNVSNLPKLKRLYLGGNRVKSFLSFEGLESLQFLHLRNNYVF